MTTKQAKDPMGDRLKTYEPDERLSLQQPIVARLDGRGFSRFTKGLSRPYDKRFRDAMLWAVNEMVKSWQCDIAYEQSDEITLVWFAKTGEDIKIDFAGRTQKLVSSLAADITSQFQKQVARFLPIEYSERMPTFDARVYNVPNNIEAYNVLLWRQFDCIRNSVLNQAHVHIGHSAMSGKTVKELVDILDASNPAASWFSLPASYRYGTFHSRHKMTVKFTKSEIEALPPKHHARKNPNLKFTRTVVAIESAYLLMNTTPLELIRGTQSHTGWLNGLKSYADIDFNTTKLEVHS